jgi:hypothetical protein
MLSRYWLIAELPDGVRLRLLAEEGAATARASSSASGKSFSCLGLNEDLIDQVYAESFSGLTVA